MADSNSDNTQLTSPDPIKGKRRAIFFDILKNVNEDQCIFQEGKKDLWSQILIVHPKTAIQLWGFTSKDWQNRNSQGEIGNPIEDGSSATGIPRTGNDGKINWKVRVHRVLPTGQQKVSACQLNCEEGKGESAYYLNYDEDDVLTAPCTTNNRYWEINERDNTGIIVTAGTYRLEYVQEDSFAPREKVYVAGRAIPFDDFLDRNVVVTRDVRLWTDKLGQQIPKQTGMWTLDNQRDFEQVALWNMYDQDGRPIRYGDSLVTANRWLRFLGTEKGEDAALFNMTDWHGNRIVNTSPIITADNMREFKAPWGKLPSNRDTGEFTPDPSMGQGGLYYMTDTKGRPIHHSMALATAADLIEWKTASPVHRQFICWAGDKVLDEHNGIEVSFNKNTYELRITNADVSFYHHAITGASNYLLGGVSGMPRGYNGMFYTVSNNEVVVAEINNFRDNIVCKGTVWATRQNGVYGIVEIIHVDDRGFPEQSITSIEGDDFYIEAVDNNTMPPIIPEPSKEK